MNIKALIRSIAKTCLKPLIRRASITVAGDDSQDYLRFQCEYFGRASTVHAIYPYGFCGNPPLESLAHVFQLNGNEENKAGIANLDKLRFRTEPGEAACGNYFTRSRVKFLNNGDIEVFSANDRKTTITNDEIKTVGNNQTVTITVNNTRTVGGDQLIDITGDNTRTVGGNELVDITGNDTKTVDGNMSVTVDGNTNVTVLGTTALTSTGDVTITAPLTTIEGNLTVTGATTLSTTVTSGGKDISNTHTHIGSPSAPLGGVTPTGAVV